MILRLLAGSSRPPAILKTRTGPDQKAPIGPYADAQW